MDSAELVGILLCESLYFYCVAKRNFTRNSKLCNHFIITLYSPWLPTLPCQVKKQHEQQLKKCKLDSSIIWARGLHVQIFWCLSCYDPCCNCLRLSVIFFRLWNVFIHIFFMDAAFNFFEWQFSFIWDIDSIKAYETVSIWLIQAR